MKCPCGFDAAFEDCCGRFLSGKLQPQTAEELTRSRYTAYAKRREDYLEDTLHPRERTKAARGKTWAGGARSEPWARDATWDGLEIRELERGGAEDKDGVVSYSARYTLKGVSHTLEERALLEKHRGRWFYVKAEQPEQAPAVRDQLKVGRNDPCPCGSGKKHKKCCGSSQ
ncbi:MAG: SEC-C domain-containing protein [Armatimonadetes bacterium]|nr:SEC-C domain-containing protein [Armatimonadota bacterium]